MVWVLRGYREKDAFYKLEVIATTGLNVAARRSHTVCMILLRDHRELNVTSRFCLLLDQFIGWTYVLCLF